MLDEIKRLFGNTLEKYNLKVTETCKRKQVYWTTNIEPELFCYTITKGDNFIFSGNYSEVLNFLHNFSMYEKII